MTAEAKTATAVRTITIVTTRGEKRKVPFEGTEWKDLKALLQKGGKDIEGNPFPGYDLSNMKCVESVKRNTLEHPQAVVPDGDFNLFLMPYKSKSGAMSRADINSTIKGFIEKDGQVAKDHFTVDGKNYTQVGSAKLEELIESYKPGTKKATAKAKAEATANVADVVASVKDHKENALFEELQGLSTDEKLDVVIKLLVDMKNGKPAASISEALAPEVPTAPAETEEQKAERLRKEEEARLAKEAEEKAEAERKEKARLKKEEDERLEKEMREMAGGFPDVRL